MRDWALKKKSTLLNPSTKLGGQIFFKFPLCLLLVFAYLNEEKNT